MGVGTPKTYTAVNDTAQMLTPVNGGMLTGTSGTFTWTSGTGVSAYGLWVGSAPNTYDIYGAQVAGTSQVVTLPADGRQMFVNLLSVINGAGSPTATPTQR